MCQSWPWVGGPCRRNNVGPRRPFWKHPCPCQRRHGINWSAWPNSVTIDREFVPPVPASVIDVEVALWEESLKASQVHEDVDSVVEVAPVVPDASPCPVLFYKRSKTAHEAVLGSPANGISAEGMWWATACGCSSRCSCDLELFPVAPEGARFCGAHPCVQTRQKSAVGASGV